MRWQLGSYAAFQSYDFNILIKRGGIEIKRKQLQRRTTMKSGKENLLLFNDRRRPAYGISHVPT